MCMWSGNGAEIFEQDIRSIVDRIDIHIEVTPVPFKELSSYTGNLRKVKQSEKE